MRLVTRARAAAKGSTLRICEPMWTQTPAGSSHLDFLRLCGRWRGRL